MITGVNDKGYDKVFCGEMIGFLAWLLGKFGIVFGWVEWIVTREEVQKYRNEVGNSPKYKPVLDDIQRQKRGFQAAKDNPQEYLKAIFNAKMNGDIK